MRDLVSTLSFHEVMQRLLDRTLLHLRAELGSILLCEEDRTLRILVSHGLPEAVVRESRVKEGEGISGYVVKTGESLLVEDVENDPRFQRRNRERYYTSSCISAPLAFHGCVQGVLNINNKSDRQAFTAHDIELLEVLAGHAALALANAYRYEQVVALAQHDALTGLANYGHFMASAKAELGRVQRQPREFSLVMLDVDHFKAYNDRYGHLCGDRILQGVAKLIQERSRVSDLPARYGGEEFCVLLPETPCRGATSFAEKIRQAVEYGGYAPEGCEPVTISLGVATYPADGTTLDDLVQAADAQLYRAKAEGRNRVCAPRCSPVSLMRP